MEITVPAALYAELPIRVFASVNADAVLSVSSVNSNTGETIPELGNPRSTPADAKFRIVAELPPEDDMTGPKLLSISGTATQASDKSFPVTITFDEALKADSLTTSTANTVFTVTNGAITGVDVTGNPVFILTVLPDPGDTVVVIKYNEGVVKDVAENTAEATDQETATQFYANLDPREVIEKTVLTPTVDANAGGGDEITVTLTPSTGATVTLTSADFTVMEGTTEILSAGVTVEPTEATGDTAWELSFTTNDTLTEDSVVTVIVSSTSSHRYELISTISVGVDRTGPAVTFTEPSQSVKPNEAATVTIAVSGADTLETLELADISVIQTAEDGTASVLSHTFNIRTGMVVFTPTAEGTVVVTVEADAVADEFGNMNSETVSDEIQISIEEIDTTVPEVTIGTPVAQNGSIVFTFTFTETVTFTHEHITVTNAMALTAANLVQSSTNARMYTLTVTPVDAADDGNSDTYGRRSEG